MFQFISVQLIRTISECFTVAIVNFVYSLHLYKEFVNLIESSHLDSTFKFYSLIQLWLFSMTRYSFHGEISTFPTVFHPRFNLTKPISTSMPITILVMLLTSPLNTITEIISYMLMLHHVYGLVNLTVN